MSIRNRSNRVIGGSARGAGIIAALLMLFPVAAPAQHEGHIAPPAAAKQEAAAPAEAPTVEIPLDKQQIMGVRTVVVAPRQIGKIIRTVGRVEYDERKLATVSM